MDISGRIRAILERHRLPSHPEAVTFQIATSKRTPGGHSPADLLWQYWISIVTSEKATRREDLWERAFAGQSSEGYLHKLDAETLLDAFVYEELQAIHAAYNIAKTVGKPEMMERVRLAVRWHMEHTQPDHTTSEPWGLAAFSALDETGMFAELQLHAAEEMLGRIGPEKGAVTLALLGDALLTMNDQKRER